MSSNNRIKYFAHILIVISFLLFSTAAYINICENISYNPPKIISNEPNSIIEEPIEEATTTTEVVKTDKEKTTKKEPVKPVDNTTKKVEVKTQPKTDTRKNVIVSDPNQELRINMENTYSIDIKYGDEVKGYSVGGMNVNVETNSSVINKALNKLNNDLSLYPNGMLDEVQNNSK